METPQQERRVYRWFRISVFLKGLFSVAEIVGGVLAFFIPPALVASVVITLAGSELSEDPGDFIATHLVALAQQFSFASGTFIALYLLSRGLIKLGLVIALLKNKLWAYPSSLAVLGLFILYQLYQIALTHSPIIIGLTLFDFVVIYFIWQEYVIVREHLRGHH